MSKDAQHDRPSDHEPAATTSGTMEILLRLPDVRKMQETDTQRTEASSDSSDDDNTGLPQKTASSTSAMGPFLESFRRRWSTWKNAAMFAQVGVSGRFLVVGGLILGMVVAAYTLVDRKGSQENKEVEPYDTAQEPLQLDEQPAPSPPVAAIPAVERHAKAVEPNSPIARTAQAPVPRVPRARLELETDSNDANSIQPAINVIETRQREPETFSADTRNRDTYRALRDYRNQPVERPADHRGNHAKFERNRTATEQGNRVESRRDTTFQPQGDPYAPVGRQPNREASRYGGPAARGRNDGAGFRGTIEPAPYRN